LPSVHFAMRTDLLHILSLRIHFIRSSPISRIAQRLKSPSIPNSIYPQNWRATFIEPGELASFADELEGILLIDEAYIDFADDNCVNQVKDFDNVIILRSMSKGYGLAGLRFGYAIASPPLIAGRLKIKDSYNVNAFAIAVATAAIKDQKYFKENVERVKRDRDILIEQLRALKFKVAKSSANFVLAESKNCKASEIYDKLLKRNIYVRYFDLPGLSNKLRITVGTSEQNDKLVLTLKEILSGKGASHGKENS